MKLYAHLSVDAREEQAYIRDRSDLDATIVNLGRDRYESDTSIHVYGPPANRAAFLRSLAEALTTAAVELDVDAQRETDAILSDPHAMAAIAEAESEVSA